MRWYGKNQLHNKSLHLAFWIKITLYLLLCCVIWQKTCLVNAMSCHVTCLFYWTSFLFLFSSISISIYLSIYVYIYIYIYLYLSIYLSIYLYIYIYIAYCKLCFKRFRTDGEVVFHWSNHMKNVTKVNSIAKDLCS